ncbi:MAG: protein jag [Patescibacteria group bacterium]
MEKELVELVEKKANELLSLMGTKAKAKARLDEENAAVVLEIDAGEETGLLIGRHGETLTSFQGVLGMMVRKESGEWSRILVNIGDWREKQESYLKEMAQATAERARQTGEPQYLYNLSPSQRRVVHLALAEDKEVETFSEGEGDERYLVVRPKK